MCTAPRLILYPDSEENSTCQDLRVPDHYQTPYSFSDVEIWCMGIRVHFISESSCACSKVIYVCWIIYIGKGRSNEDWEQSQLANAIIIGIWYL